MTWRRGALLFFAALAGALIPLIPTVQVAGALTAPIELAGGLLRELSLSGPGGNVLAWAIVLLAAGLPLLLLVLPPNRGRRHWEDIFLPASSLLLIGLAFCAVNPSYLDRFFGSTLLIAAAVIWVSLLVFWGCSVCCGGWRRPLWRGCPACCGFCWWAVRPCWCLQPHPG